MPCRNLYLLICRTCLDTALQVNDVTVLELEVKGSAEPYKILLEPYAVLIPGETYIHNTIRRTFKVALSLEVKMIPFLNLPHAFVFCVCVCFRCGITANQSFTLNGSVLLTLTSLKWSPQQEK